VDGDVRGRAACTCREHDLVRGAVDARDRPVASVDDLGVAVADRDRPGVLSDGNRVGDLLRPLSIRISTSPAFVEPLGEAEVGQVRVTPAYSGSPP
jgi:hypothetical protein